MMKMKKKLFLRLKVITVVYNAICYCLCVITASRATQMSTNDKDEGEVVSSKTKCNYSSL